MKIRKDPSYCFGCGGRCIPETTITKKGFWPFRRPIRFHKCLKLLEFGIKFEYSDMGPRNCNRSRKFSLAKTPNCLPIMGLAGLNPKNYQRVTELKIKLEAQDEN